MHAGRPRHAPLALLAVALPLLAVACGEPPVAWDEAAERHLGAPPATAALTPDQAADALVRASLDSALARGASAGTATATPTATTPAGAVDHAAMGHAMPAPAAGMPAVDHAAMGHDAAAPATAPAAAAPFATMAGACAASVRTADGRGAERVAAWWAARPDGSAALWAARSVDGGRSWDRPAPVDTVDRSRAGCARPAPSVAVDTVNGYVHVAFSLEAPEGKGVFYAHRMDPRAAFEVPQVIVYGDRPAHTAVTSQGDRVVVAYEDPNTGGRPFVSLALSRTAGHTWEERFAASEGSSTAAERPVVVLRGDRLALGWVERSSPRELATTEDPRTATTALPTGVVVRVGRLR